MSAIANGLNWLTRRAETIIVLSVALGALAVLLLISAPKRAVVEAGDEIWTCSMHPQVQMTKPGRCPHCNMPLTRPTEKKPTVVTQPVQYRELFKEIRATGKLDYNERRVAYITVRFDGRVERVYADYAGIPVKANDHLVDIYSRELYSAQVELVQALEIFEQRPGDRFAQTTLESVRTKLRLLGILPEQIAQFEQVRKPSTVLTIYAPIGGVIVEKNVREQQYVKEGDMLYRIAELDPIWLFLDIYERDLAWVRYGQPVDVTVEAYPGETFRGTVVFIDPFLDDATRTVKVRVNLENSGQRLKPAMYASAAIHVRLEPSGAPQPSGLEGKYICPMHPEVVRDVPGVCTICGMPLERVPDVAPHQHVVSEGDASMPTKPQAEIAAALVGKVLAVPKSAVLDTGRRQVTYRKNKDGAYELVELKLGPLAASNEAEGMVSNYFPVLAGLSFGDEVVVQGGFLLDSQRQIEGMPSLLFPQGQAGAALHAGHGEHSGHAK